MRARFASSIAKLFAKLFALILFAHGAVACVPLFVTAAAVTTVDIASDRRTTGAYVDDNALELKLRAAFVADPQLDGVNISVTVFNGVVLLSGEVGADIQRVHAGELAMSFEETAKIVNELELAGRTNITSRFNDSWITAKVKARLLNDLDLPSAHAIKVVTEHGRVYLLGRVSQSESEQAVESIRGVRGVTHIVKVFEYVD